MIKLSMPTSGLYHEKLFVALLTVLSFSAVAADAQRPDAASRTYAQNYKDAALALCVAKAYASEPGASKDAAASASGLDNWSEYDAEKGAGKMGELVDKYLAREYHSHQGERRKTEPDEMHRHVSQRRA
ncbi:hypothetical protein CWS02_23345 [Enterobacter sp. EA-1]|nr:hypothetical protein CWS02_23345 [Enterobacter sp. EA-1]